MRKKLIGRILPALLLLCLAAAAFCQTGTVRRSSNGRQSPSTTAEIVAHLLAGTQIILSLNRQREGYYYVRTADGIAGWVWSRNVASLSAAITVPGAPSPNVRENRVAPGNLVKRLHAAQVVAVAQPLVIGNQIVCAPTGDSNNRKTSLKLSILRRIEPIYRTTRRMFPSTGAIW